MWLNITQACKSRLIEAHAVVTLCFFKAGTTDILFHWYVCVWAEGAPPQDYLEGERLRFTSGGCYVGESFSKNHRYGTVSNSLCSLISTFCRAPCCAVSLIPVSQLAASSCPPHGLGLFSNYSNLPVGNHFSRFCCEWRLQSSIGGRVRCCLITGVLTSIFAFHFVFSLSVIPPPHFCENRLLQQWIVPLFWVCE